MKFQNGCWLLKEGYECFSPQQVYEIKKEKKQIILYTPTTPIRHKGDTLGGINLTIKISVPAPEVIRVQTFHHMGTKQKSPLFELDFSEEENIDVTHTKESIIVRSGMLSLVIDLKDQSMTYKREEELLTKSSDKSLGYIKEDWKGFTYDDKAKKSYMCQQLGLSVGELIYGLGERFTPFVKNGQSVSIWNEDGGTSTEQSYKNIPFYLSNKGYGVFVNHPERVEFEVGTEQVSKVQFSVEGEELDYFVINGPTMKQVISRYTSLTGKPARLPKWSFGLWLSTSFTTDYDEDTVMSFIEGMEKREIPLSVFHFDCCWMKEFHWMDFIWDERVFKDPKGMLTRIKQKGIKVCVWINPYVAQQSNLFEEGVQEGYFIKRKDQQVWQWDMWQPGMAIVDFTNERACKWYQKKLEMLLDMGVDCFKTDFGERIPTDVVYANGANPMKMHNYYSYLYNQVVYEVLEKKRGKEEAVLFARSATVGGQKYPVHWGGDCWSDYESMEQSLRGGLSLTSSGFGYWSHDIGGFESQSTPDVYKRWAAFGLLSTHSRLHGSTSYRVPWVYDEEAVLVVKYFTDLKLRLLPYLYSQSIQTSNTGIPLMRSMILEFEEDKNCSYLDKQYMLGDSLLVAPIFNEKGVASYYLPQGNWTNYLTKEKSQGGIWREEVHDYCSIPLWVRENSILPLDLEAKNTESKCLEHLELQIYELGEKADCMVYQEPKKYLKVQITKKDSQIQVRLEGDANITLRFVNANIDLKEGGLSKREGEDTVIRVEKGFNTLRCNII